MPSSVVSEDSNSVVIYIINHSLKKKKKELLGRQRKLFGEKKNACKGVRDVG